jgi:hypothetical protein
VSCMTKSAPSQQWRPARWGLAFALRTSLCHAAGTQFLLATPTLEVVICLPPAVGCWLQVLEEGLGAPADSVFEWLSEEPIAAASLGQVRLLAL